MSPLLANMNHTVWTSNFVLAEIVQRPPGGLRIFWLYIYKIRLKFNVYMAGITSDLAKKLVSGRSPGDFCQNNIAGPHGMIHIS